MRFALTMLALAATALVVIADDPKGKAKDEDAILGTWKFDKFDDGNGPGDPPEPLDKSRMTFSKDGKMKMTGGPGGEEKIAKFKLDPAAKVKTIDLIDGGETSNGIYELDGDTLKLSIAPPGKARPTEMKPNGRGGAIVTLKRVKEEKKDK